jgi:hypothetical protein
MRQFLGLGVGLVIGVLGAILFQQSLPPEDGSTSEKLEETTVELRKAERTIAALKADGKRDGSRRTVRDGMRTIAERVRRGEDVSLDDIFWTMKPWLQDMSPLFDRIRQVEQEEHFDSLAGRYSRDYDLSDADREALKQWLIEKGEQNAKEFRRVVFDPTSGFVDFARVSRFDDNDVEGIDEFMESRLRGEALEEFREERLLERVESVQEDANRRLQRINEVVQLDDNQLDPMFAVMARGSEDYRPTMEFDGMGDDTAPIDRGEREAAIRSVLREDQLQRYEQYEAERRAKAEAEMRRIGLTLPKNWQLLDDEGF